MGRRIVPYPRFYVMKLYDPAEIVWGIEHEGARPVVFGQASKFYSSHHSEELMTSHAPETWHLVPIEEIKRSYEINFKKDWLSAENL